MANIGVTEAANFIPEVWANKALRALANYSIFFNLVNRNYDELVATSGDTVHIPVNAALSVNDKAANTGVTLQTPTATKVDVSLDKHKEVSFIVEDIAKAQANQDIMQGYMEDGLLAIAEQVDSDLMALYSGLSENTGTGGTDIGADTIVDARKLLTDGKAPLTDRRLVISSKDEAALLKVEKFTSSNWVQDAGQAMKDAYLGRRYGFDIFVHQGVKTSGTSPVTTHNLAFHKNAFVLVSRPLPQAPPNTGVLQTVVNYKNFAIRVTYGYDKSQLGMQVTLDCLYGVAELRDAFGVDVYG